MLEKELVHIVVAALVNDLSKQFARGLGAVSIELGHVNIIDEKDHLLAGLRLEHVLSQSIEVALNGIHQVGRRGLTREVDEGGEKVFRGIHQEVFGDHGFTHTGLSHDEGVVAVTKDFIDEELVLNGIVGGHQDIKEVLFRVELVVLCDLLVPLLELVRLLVNSLLVDVQLVQEVSLVLGHYLLEVDSELVAVGIMHVGANRPDNTEGNVVVNHAVLIDVLVVKLDRVLVQENLDKAQARGNEVAGLRLNGLLHSGNLHDQLFKVSVNHLFYSGELICMDYIMHLLEPGLDETLPAQVNGLQKDHTATRDCSGRGNFQVVDFEKHSASVWHSDSLTVVKTEHLVVIEHSVHVLNPESIDRTVETDPSLPVRL